MRHYVAQGPSGSYRWVSGPSDRRPEETVRRLSGHEAEDLIRCQEAAIEAREEARARD